MKSLYTIRSIFFAGAIGWVSITQGQEIPQRQNPGINSSSYAKTAKYDVYHGLNLSREQQKNLQILNKDIKAQTKTVSDDSTLSRKEKKEQLSALKEQQVTKRKAILTDEQNEQFEKNLKAYRENGKAAQNRTVTNNMTGGKGKDDNGLSKSVSKKASKGNTKALQLSADQKEKLKALMEDNRRKAQDIKDNPSLSAQEKRRQYEIVKQQQDMALSNILTPEQKTIWLQNQQQTRISKPANRYSTQRGMYVPNRQLYKN